jgi:hypothetical protein
VELAKSSNLVNKKPFPIKKTIIAVIASALFIAAGSTVTFLLAKTDLRVSATITLPDESTLWLDEPFEVHGIVQSNVELPAGYSYEVVSRTGKMLLSGSITPDVKSFKFSGKIERMDKSIQYTLNIFDEVGELEFSIETKKLSAVTTRLPTECDLPMLEGDYGPLEISRAGTETEQLDQSTFYCMGETVGSWWNETFIGIGPQVNYSNQSYYAPKRNKWTDWLETVEYLLSTYPNQYTQTNIGGYSVLYECYVPNPGDPQDIQAIINVHGVQIDYWNEGCLEQNTKYMLEAVNNVPTYSLN